MFKLHVQPITSSFHPKTDMSCPERANNPLANVRPSIPVRRALSLYVTGACKTKKEASEAAGLHPQYLTMLTSPGGGSSHVKDLMAEMEEALLDANFDMSKYMTMVGRMAAAKTATLIHSGNERIALDASKEMMDRSPETQKTQKLQVDSFTLDGKDVAALVSALTESKRTEQQYAAAKSGIVELSIDNFEKPTPALPLQPKVDDK